MGYGNDPGNSDVPGGCTGLVWLEGRIIQSNPIQSSPIQDHEKRIKLQLEQTLDAGLGRSLGKALGDLWTFGGAFGL